MFRPPPASDDPGTAAGVSALARDLPPVALSEFEREDWDCLFQAVMTRLSLTAGERRGATTQAQDPAQHMAAVVLDCVDALGRLHRMVPRARR